MDAASMRTLSFAINTNSRKPDVAIGFVKAEIVTRALALNGHAKVKPVAAAGQR
jgi:hypothetical protein